MDTNQILYYAFTVLSLICAVVFNTFYGKAFHISKRGAFSFTAVIYLLSYVLMYGWMWLEKLLLGEGTLSSSRVVFIVPLLCLLCARFWKIRAADACEFMAPFFYIARGVAKYGCIFPGCCHGRPSSWGIYSHVAGTVCFPLQPIEATGTLLIAFFAVWYSRRHGFRAGGKSYALSLVLFGCFRYVMEFFNTSERVFLQMTEYSFYAIAMVLLGLIGLYLLDRTARRRSTSHLKG